MLYRRSVYRFIKRMVSTPEMEAFDGTDRIAACARRNHTNTPLAALTLMNDVTFLEAARALAQKTLQEGGALMIRAFPTWLGVSFADRWPIQKRPSFSRCSPARART